MDRSAKTGAAKRLYVALANGDREALAQLLHPDFTGVATAGLPLGLGGSYDSPEAMQREFWWRIGRTWEAAAEPDEVHELDDGRVAVIGTYRGHTRATGADLEAAFIHLLSFADDRIVALDQLTDSAAWAATLPADEPTTIDYRVDDAGIARVVLNRPHARNAIDTALARDTLLVARRIADDRRIRAVLITAKGEHFSVGGDISAFLEDGVEVMGDTLRRMVSPYHEAFAILSRIDAPIVTAARGAVAGGGIGFVYASDVSLASDTSRFVTAFADLGVSGDGGWSWHLPRRVGAARAAAITLLNKPVGGAEAEQIGLVSQCVPDAELDAAAEDVAQRLAAGPTRGLGRLRRLLRDSWTRGLEEQLLAEVDALAQTGQTRDAQRAVEAFVAKRRPEFEGR